MGKTNISWTDVVWNPTTGCSKTSNGCKNCYAETLDRRFQHDGPFVPWTVAAQYQAQVATSGEYSPITLHPERLDAPLRWRKPRRVFVNSMSDLFHEAVPDEFIDRAFAVMALAKQHVFQVLTKRPERMLQYLRPRNEQAVLGGGSVPLAGESFWPEGLAATRIITLIAKCDPHQKGPFPRLPVWPLPNVHLGVSCENQRYADERIPILAQVPAAVRFISFEPLLSAIDTSALLKAHSWQWSIIGGESGPKARPMNVEWARRIIRDCQRAGVPAFYKQGGASNRCPHDAKGGHFDCFPDDLKVREFP